MFPTYEATAAVLKQMGITEDFISTGDLRYNHHTLGNLEFYFVSNKTNKFDFYTKDSPVLESGLLGPGKIMAAN